MGYACPVCDVPQRDERHLADHLAFTAILRHEAHEAWLDEHVPGWAGQSPADLGPRVAELAGAAEFDEVFEDTVHGHEHGRPDVSPGAHGRGTGGGRVTDGVDDPEVQAVLREARELTREMYDTRDDSDGADGETDETDETASDRETDADDV